ncbi:MAG: MFS transporter [Dehalococcoidia bacterium]
MQTRAENKFAACPVYLLLSGVTAFLFRMAFTISAIYIVTSAHLNPLQIALVGTVLESATFFCQFPTAALADIDSRRLSIIAGAALMGAGLVLWGAIPRFASILLANVIWALGYTFTSGAEQSWIADEVGDERAGAVYLGASEVGQIGGLLGMPISVALASIRLNLPYFVGGAGLVFLAILLLICPNTAWCRRTTKGVTHGGGWWRRCCAGSMRCGESPS